MLTKSESEPVFAMRKFELNRELATSLKTGMFSERLRKELLDEAYKSQVDKQYSKAIYFYKQVLSNGLSLKADDHARLAYSLEHSSQRD